MGDVQPPKLTSENRTPGERPPRGRRRASLLAALLVSVAAHGAVAGALLTGGAPVEMLPVVSVEVDLRAPGAVSSNPSRAAAARPGAAARAAATRASTVRRPDPAPRKSAAPKAVAPKVAVGKPVAQKPPPQKTADRKAAQPVPAAKTLSPKTASPKQPSPKAGPTPPLAQAAPPQASPALRQRPARVQVAEWRQPPSRTAPPPRKVAVRRPPAAKAARPTARRARPKPTPRPRTRPRTRQVAARMTRHPVTRPTTSPARSHATLPSGSAPASTPANTRPGAAGPAGAAVPPRPAGGFGGNPAPSYPEEARQRGWEGRVVLRVRVTADGRPASVAVSGSSGYHALDQAALSAVRRWRFRPARRAGLAVAGTVTIPIRFRLRR